jgi:hypothetical protein
MATTGTTMTRLYFKKSFLVMGYVLFLLQMIMGFALSIPALKKLFATGTATSLDGVLQITFFASAAITLIVGLVMTFMPMVSINADSISITLGAFRSRRFGFDDLVVKQHGDELTLVDKSGLGENIPMKILSPGDRKKLLEALGRFMA